MDSSKIQIENVNTLFCSVFLSQVLLTWCKGRGKIPPRRPEKEEGLRFELGLKISPWIQSTPKMITLAPLPHGLCQRVVLSTGPNPQPSSNSWFTLRWSLFIFPVELSGLSGQVESLKPAQLHSPFSKHN